MTELTDSELQHFKGIMDLYPDYEGGCDECQRLEMKGWIVLHPLIGASTSRVTLGPKGEAYLKLLRDN